MQSKIEERYLETFYNDLDEIISYISNILKSKKAANDLLYAIENEIDKRTPIADSFKKYKSTKHRDEEYYKLTVKNFYIFYVAINEKGKSIVEYRRILYKRRNWKEII